jgi:hypothetical protein
MVLAKTIAASGAAITMAPPEFCDMDTRPRLPESRII